MSDNLNFIFRTKAVEQAAATLTHQRAALFRPDGTPKFAPAELAEQQAQLLAPLQAAVAEAEAVAIQAETEAAALEQMRHADPIATLPPAELERAAALRPFVADFCEKEPLTAIAERLEAVVAHGSAAEKALYARYAQRRHDATLEVVSSGRVRLQPGDSNALAAITTAAAALRTASIQKPVADALAQATALRQRAGELRTFARDTLAAADGTRRRQQEQVSAQYRSIF